MIHIIVAFPSQEAARSIKKILVQNGYHVDAVCMTGAQVLQAADDLNGGILICGYRFVDMMYEELYHYMPDGFQMLLTASPANCNSRKIQNIVCLSTPLKANELLATVRMMENTYIRMKKKKNRPKERNEQEKTLITEAKALLMERNNLSEEEAHRYIQKSSMDNGTDFTETAQMILSLFS